MSVGKQSISVPIQQVAQLSQRDRAAGWVSYCDFGRKSAVLCD